MKSKKMNDDCCKQVRPKRAKSECGEMKDKDKKYIINATANTNITIINNILNPQRRNFIVDNTNDLTIKKSNLKNCICSPVKKVNFDINEFYADKKSLFEKENNDCLKRFKTHFIPYIEDDINLKEDKSPKVNKNKRQTYEHSKEEIKLLYKSKSDSCTYDKRFGSFYGFFATTFKNYKKVNEDKIRISINNPMQIENKNNKKIIQKNNKTDSSTPNKDIHDDDDSPFSSSRLFQSDEDSVVENTIHFFGLYDGHRGDYTSQYLKDTLHNTILQNIPILISKPFSFITNAFNKIDNYLYTQCEKKFNEIEPYDKSGSCAHIFISFNNKIFIANCGDSRSIISVNMGKTISQLSIDHKPNLKSEKKRIDLCGGKIVQNEETLNIPRIIPGGLNVARTIGDFQIKSPLTGGIKEMIISTPDIIEIDIKKEIDFILIGCDGIYDKLTNKEITQIIFSSVKRCLSANIPFNQMLSVIGRNIISKAIDNGSRDNLSLILIIMNNLYECIINKDIERINKALLDMKMSINRCDMLYPFWVNYQGEDSSYLHYVSEDSMMRKTSSAVAYENVQSNQKQKMNELNTTGKKKKKRKLSFWQLLGKCTCK